MPKASSLIKTKSSWLARPYPYLHESLALCSAQELGTILQLIGDLKTGTKPTQYQRLQDQLRKPRIRHPVNGPTRIVSIDMGIRNLAFCVLDVGNQQQHNSTGLHRAAKPVSTRNDASLAEVVPRLPWALDQVEVVAWKRLSLLEALSGVTGFNDSSTNSKRKAGSRAEKARSGKASSKRTAVKKYEEHVEAEGSDSSAEGTSFEPEVSSVDDIETPSSGTPDYTPINVAKMAYRLVKDILLPFNATHVLIERQRHRSGGAPAVQEWTVRVNMLESMLHAILETFRHSGSHLQLFPAQHPLEQNMIALRPTLGADNQILPAVHSVNPAQVNSLWLDPDLSSTLHKRYPSSSNDNLKSGKSEYDPEEATFKDGLARTYQIDLTNTGKTKGAVTKARKIQIAELWARRYLSFSKDAQRSCDRFLAARVPFKANSSATNITSLGTRKEATIVGNVRLQKKPTSSDVMEELDDETLTPDDKKLDDLADCLLQGVAWVQWELNRRMLGQVLLVHEQSTTQEKDSISFTAQPLALGDLEAWPRSPLVISDKGEIVAAASASRASRVRSEKAVSTTKGKPKKVKKPTKIKDSG